MRRPPNPALERSAQQRPRWVPAAFFAAGPGLEQREVRPRGATRLELFEIANFETDTAPGAWGIPEPERGKPVKLADIGLVVVPGAAFDAKGNRIGYGAGFYDKLLPLYRGRTVALAFDLQIIPEAPADSHDIPVQKLITETRIIEAKA